MLKDYPQYVDDLQGILNRLFENPKQGVPIFEQAIWLLEDALGSYVTEARDELKVAQTSGDPVVIENAKRKEFDIGSARLNMGGMSDLHDYLEENWGRP